MLPWTDGAQQLWQVPAVGYTRGCSPSRPSLRPRLALSQSVPESRWHSPGVSLGGNERGCYLKVAPDQVKAIPQMVGRGEGTTAVARITGLSRPTIYRMPENQKRKGS
jgi:hypothetical protein